MFDEEDYYSDEEENVFQSHKAITSSKILTPASNSDFNHLTGDSESLLKMMKQRGIDLSDNQIKKLNVRNQSAEKPAKQVKGRSGFFDGGTSASLEQLIKALNKSLAKADPQQASCILSYILERKNLPVADLNKFGVMKCKLLFGLGAYKDCEQKAQQLICKACDNLKGALFSNYLAKCKIQNSKIFEGYLDLLRAKSLINKYKVQQQQKANTKSQAISAKEQKSEQKIEISEQRKKLQLNFKDSQVDSVLRQIDYSQMQYNIKIKEVKNCINVVYPYFTEFKNRKIKQIACGDFHALFLVEGSYDSSESTLSNQWKTQIFGMGENGVGQISGSSNINVYKQPTLIPELSGKGITGIYAFKQSSLCFNKNGDIYEWGVKQNRNDEISITYSIGQQIQSIQKGNKHYALMTKSKKFYTWGQIQSKGAVIYKQAKPHMHPSANIINYSCGSSCIICVDDRGQAFGIGNNQYGQLYLKGEFFSKTFKKIPDQILGKVKNVICISDCTFFVNEDNQVYFSGKYSHNKQPQENLRQAEFSGQITNLISLCGHTGSYFATNEKGEIFKWDVDSNVKFRSYKDNPEAEQRLVISEKSQLFRMKSQVNPQYCSVKQITKNAQSYQQIKFELQLRDKYGLYGNKQFLIAPRCQIHLSTFEMTKDEILKQNKQFLERYRLSTFENRILLNEIIDPKLNSYKIAKSQNQPWLYDLEITVDNAGKYYFYIVLEETLLFSTQLSISLSSKESQMSQKNVLQKKAKQEQRRKRAQLQKKRLLQQKLRKQQQQQQKRKQTQKRAQQALKRHMKQKQQQTSRLMQQRKARKQLQTGGGFDLTKLAKKKSSQLKPEVQIKQIKQPRAQMQKTNQSFMKSSQSFLPDINARPGSKRKLTFRKESVESAKNVNPLQKTAGFTNDSKGFLTAKTKDLGKTLVDPKTQMSSKLTQGKTIIKRGGLSRPKK